MFSRIVLSSLSLLYLSGMACAASMTNGVPTKVNNLVANAAFYGDHDGRQTEDQYAATHGISPKELKNKLAATGVLRCGVAEASANITYKSNVISTVAHIFENPDTCKEERKPTACVFIYNFNNRQTSVPVDKLVEWGPRCPTVTDGRDDWAVMKLRYPAIGPRPYKLPTGDSADIWHSQKVIAVAASSVDFCLRAGQACVLDPATSRRVFPKTVENCEIEQVYGGIPPTFFSSICGSSQGASGGGILDTLSDTATLLGIFGGNRETMQMVENEIKTGVAQGGPYNEKTWATYHVPVAGAFLNAIRKAGDE